ncbi:uncharacterized protein LOC135126423 [Zophobas morio]|uniref:uncharacterized protein LOC135126423 n=1 Tax=Zophobas morio TaxID=2755281 RepID=UPI003082E3E9
MRNLAWLAVLLLRFGFSGCSSPDLDFLTGFFRGKPAVVTSYNCWSKSKNVELVKSLANSPDVHFSGYYTAPRVDTLKKYSNIDYLVLDLRNCLPANLILLQLNQSNTFVYPLKYLLLIDKPDFSSLSAELGQYQILPNCELVIAVFDNDSAFLYETYKVGKKSELTWENYGNWTLEGGLHEHYWNVPTSQRRMDLKGANLVVCLVVFVNDTLNHLDDYKDPGVDTFTKQDYESTMCMLQHMRVNHTFSIVDNYGYVDAESGNFSGLVREIQSGRADVSAGSIFFTADRYAAVDLIKQGNPHAIRFVVRKPATSFMKNIFFITFNTGVWIASTAILATFALSVLLILNWETQHKEKVKQNKYSVSDVTLIALEAVCQQGTTTDPQSFAGRILALILFGAFMFIYVSYSANIVVLLQSTTKINTIEELVESRIEVGGEEIHYMKNYFEAVKKGPLKKLYDRKIYPNQYFPLKVGMEKVRKGNFAFHVASQSAYDYILHHFTNHEICGLQELPGFIEENLGYLAVPKRSPYKDLFKVAILKVDEYGLQRRSNLRIVMQPKCYSQGASFETIGFVDCEKVLYVWIFGTISAFVILLMENLIHRCVKRIKREKWEFSD